MPEITNAWRSIEYLNYENQIKEILYMKLSNNVIMRSYRLDDGMLCTGHCKIQDPPDREENFRAAEKYASLNI